MKKKREEKSDKGVIPTREEVVEKLRASNRRLVENLIAARAVAPDDLSPKDRKELDRAIGMAEQMSESIEKALKEGCAGKK